MKKTDTSKKSSGTVKRKTNARKSASQKSKSPIKHGKVSISPTKVIWLCCAVIAVCLALLLVTSVGGKSDEKKSQKNAPSIAERFEKEDGNKTNERSLVEEKKSEKTIEKKSDTKKETQSENKVPAKKQTAPKESEQKKNTTDSKQSEQKKNETSVKQSESKSLVTVAPSENELAKKKADTSNDNKVASVSQQSPKVPEQSNQSKQPEQKPVSNKFNFPPAVNSAELILLFDDGGQNLNQLQPFLELPIPITVAVLPKLPHSAESAERVRKSGNEVMLHQPMQAINSNVNPGPGAIKPDMTSLEIAELVQSNIDEIAPIVGMNNHEGSLITADESKISVVLDVADKNGIFFLDSRTNVETKVPVVCKRAGYSWYERNGRFLDNEKTREEFLTELRKNLDIANKSGSVIMIAHIWSADYLPGLIREVYPELRDKGYTFTTVSKSSARKF